MQGKERIYHIKSNAECEGEAMGQRRKVEARSYDVVVVGGGMTGICAAIASARYGASTALIQDRPVLGGNASSEIRMHICGADANQIKRDAQETGILHEILLENKARNDYYNYSIWDSVLLEKVHGEPNLKLFLNTSMSDVTVESGASVRYSILDSGVTVGAGATVGEARGTASGIAVVGANYRIPVGETVAAGAMIYG